MAALSGITAIRPTDNTAPPNNVMYGGTLAVGVPVYKDAADSDKHKASDANASTATAAVVGLTVSPGVSGGYGWVVAKGSIVLVGTTMVVGETYYAGPTAGEIIPSGELAPGDNVTRIGTAATTTQLDLDIKATGIPHA